MNYLSIVLFLLMYSLDRRLIFTLIAIFIQVKFGNTTFKTDVCHKSLNPQWNSEWFKFEVRCFPIMTDFSADVLIQFPTMKFIGGTTNKMCKALYICRFF